MLKIKWDDLAEGVPTAGAAAKWGAARRWGSMALGGSYSRTSAFPVGMDRDSHERLLAGLTEAALAYRVAIGKLNNRLTPGLADSFKPLSEDRRSSKAIYVWPRSIKSEALRETKAWLSSRGKDESGLSGVASLAAVGRALDTARPDLLLGVKARIPFDEGETAPRCFTVRIPSGAYYKRPFALSGNLLEIGGLGKMEFIREKPSGDIARFAYVEAAHWDQVWRLRFVEFTAPVSEDFEDGPPVFVVKGG